MNSILVWTRYIIMSFQFQHAELGEAFASMLSNRTVSIPEERFAQV
jgi:hypothetical protein